MPNRILREGILTSERTRRRSGIWPVAIRRLFADKSCAICGCSTKITIDHIVALANGGTNHVSNLQALCAPCNLYKGARKTQEEMVAWYANNKNKIDADRAAFAKRVANLDSF